MNWHNICNISNIMKEILKRCQACQAQAMNTMSNGYSFYVTLRTEWTISATLFRENNIEMSWYFYSWRDDENNAVAAEMEEYIKNLK